MYLYIGKKFRFSVRVIALTTAMAMLYQTAVYSVGILDVIRGVDNQRQSRVATENLRREQRERQRSRERFLGMNASQLRALDRAQREQQTNRRKLDQQLRKIQREIGNILREQQETKDFMDQMAEDIASKFPSGQVTSRKWTAKTADGNTIRGVEKTRTSARGTLKERTGTPEISPDGVITGTSDFKDTKYDRGGNLLTYRSSSTSLDDSGNPVQTTYTDYKATQIYTKADERANPNTPAGQAAGYVITSFTLTNEEAAGFDALTNGEKLAFATGLSVDDKTTITRSNSLYYSKQDAQAAGMDGLENQPMSYAETIKSPGVEAERRTVVSQITYFERDATVPADVPDDLREEQEIGNTGSDTDILELSRVSVTTFLGVPTRVETSFVAYDQYERVTQQRDITQRGAEVSDQVTRYTYDTRNRIGTEAVIGFRVSGEGAGSQFNTFTRFQYDKFDRVIRETGFRIENGVRTDFDRRNLAFDRFNRVIEFIETEERFERTTERHRFDIEFDKNGLLVHFVEVETNDLNSIVATTIVDTIYNANGLAAETHTVVTEKGSYVGADGVTVVVDIKTEQTQRFTYDKLFRIVRIVTDAIGPRGIKTHTDKRITDFDSRSRVNSFEETFFRSFTLTFEDPILDADGNPTYDVNGTLLTRTVSMLIEETITTVREYTDYDELGRIIGYQDRITDSKFPGKVRIVKRSDMSYNEKSQLVFYKEEVRETGTVTDADGVTHTINTYSVVEHEESFNSKGQSEGFIEEGINSQGQKFRTVQETLAYDSRDNVAEFIRTDTVNGTTTVTHRDSVGYNQFRDILRFHQTFLDQNGMTTDMNRLSTTYAGPGLIYSFHEVSTHDAEPGHTFDFMRFATTYNKQLLVVITIESLTETAVDFIFTTMTFVHREKFTPFGDVIDQTTITEQTGEAMQMYYTYADQNGLPISLEGALPEQFVAGGDYPFGDEVGGTVTVTPDQLAKAAVQPGPTSQAYPPGSTLLQQQPMVLPGAPATDSTVSTLRLESLSIAQLQALMEGNPVILEDGTQIIPTPNPQKITFYNKTIEIIRARRFDTSRRPISFMQEIITSDNPFMKILATIFGIVYNGIGQEIQRITERTEKGAIKRMVLDLDQPIVGRDDKGVEVDPGEPIGFFTNEEQGILFDGGTVQREVNGQTLTFSGTMVEVTEEVDNFTRIARLSAEYDGNELSGYVEETTVAHNDLTVRATVSGLTRDTQGRTFSQTTVTSRTGTTTNRQAVGVEITDPATGDVTEEALANLYEIDANDNPIYTEAELATLLGGGTIVKGGMEIKIKVEETILNLNETNVETLVARYYDPFDRQYSSITRSYNQDFPNLVNTSVTLMTLYNERNQPIGTLAVEFSQGSIDRNILTGVSRVVPVDEVVRIDLDDVQATFNLTDEQLEALLESLGELAEDEDLALDDGSVLQPQFDLDGELIAVRLIGQVEEYSLGVLQTEFGLTEEEAQEAIQILDELGTITLADGTVLNAVTDVVTETIDTARTILSMFTLNDLNQRILTSEVVTESASNVVVYRTTRVQVDKNGREVLVVTNERRQGISQESRLKEEVTGDDGSVLHMSDFTFEQQEALLRGESVEIDGVTYTPETETYLAFVNEETTTIRSNFVRNNLDQIVGQTTTTYDFYRQNTTIVTLAFQTFHEHGGVDSFLQITRTISLGVETTIGPVTTANGTEVGEEILTKLTPEQRQQLFETGSVKYGNTTLNVNITTQMTIVDRVSIQHRISTNYDGVGFDATSYVEESSEPGSDVITRNYVFGIVQNENQQELESSTFTRRYGTTVVSQLTLIDKVTGKEIDFSKLQIDQSLLNSLLTGDLAEAVAADGTVIQAVPRDVTLVLDSTSYSRRTNQRYDLLRRLKAVVEDRFSTTDNTFTRDIQFNFIRDALGRITYQATISRVFGESTADYLQDILDGAGSPIDMSTLASEDVRAILDAKEANPDLDDIEVVLADGRKVTARYARIKIQFETTTFTSLTQSFDPSDRVIYSRETRYNSNDDTVSTSELFGVNFNDRNQRSSFYSFSHVYGEATQTVTDYFEGDDGQAYDWIDLSPAQREALRTGEVDSVTIQVTRDDGTVEDVTVTRVTKEIPVSINRTTLTIRNETNYNRLDQESNYVEDTLSSDTLERTTTRVVLLVRNRAGQETARISLIHREANGVLIPIYQGHFDVDGNKLNTLGEKLSKEQLQAIANKEDVEVDGVWYSAQNDMVPTNSLVDSVDILFNVTFDGLGRRFSSESVNFSSNSVAVSHNQTLYTIYDGAGRIIESGNISRTYGIAKELQTSYQYEDGTEANPADFMEYLDSFGQDPDNPNKILLPNGKVVERIETEVTIEINTVTFTRTFNAVFNSLGQRIAFTTSTMGNDSELATVTNHYDIINDDQNRLIEETTLVHRYGIGTQDVLVVTDSAGNPIAFEDLNLTADQVRTLWQNSKTGTSITLEDGTVLIPVLESRVVEIDILTLILTSVITQVSASIGTRVKSP